METWTCIDCLHKGKPNQHGRCERCNSQAVAITMSTVPKSPGWFHEYWLQHKKNKSKIAQSLLSILFLVSYIGCSPFREISYFPASNPSFAPVDLSNVPTNDMSDATWSTPPDKTPWGFWHEDLYHDGDTDKVLAYVINEGDFGFCYTLASDEVEHCTDGDYERAKLAAEKAIGYKRKPWQE